MCTYNITLSDALVDKVRPAFESDEALQQWLQEQVSKALELFVGGRTESEQQSMVRESLTTAFRELHSGQAIKDARHLFA
jgi:hypothetical protein